MTKTHPNLIKAIKILDQLLKNNLNNTSVLNSNFNAYFNIYGQDYAFNFLNEHILKHNLQQYVLNIENNFYSLINMYETSNDKEPILSKLQRLLKDNPLLSLLYLEWAEKIVFEHQQNLNSIENLLTQTSHIPYLDDTNTKLCNLLPKSMLRYKSRRFQTHESYLEYRINLEKTKDYMKQELDYNLFDTDNNKIFDKKFAKYFNIPVPKTYQSGVIFSKLNFIENTVIKPADPASSTSKNVFYFFDTNNIQLVRGSKKYFNTIDKLSNFIHNEIDNFISEDLWIVEELIIDTSHQPSNDFRVYCFYGNVYMISEEGPYILRSEIAFYKPDGSVIPKESSKPKDIKRYNLESLIKYANILSSNIPYPFARIDFFSDGITFYLGEITPNPGTYYLEDYYPDNFEQLDQEMGLAMLDAEARLYKDLVIGKDFSLFRRTYNLE